MRPVSSWLAPLQRALGRQIAHLRQTIDDLGRRLRESVVQAVGQAVAGAVRETLRSVLEASPPPPWQRNPGRHPSDQALLWHQQQKPKPDEWYDELEDPDDPQLLPREVDEDLDPVPPETNTSAPPARRWYTALATGLDVAAWCLRNTAQHHLPAAIGAGLTAALVSITGSPLVATGTGVAWSVIRLLSLDLSVRDRSAPPVALAHW